VGCGLVRLRREITGELLSGGCGKWNDYVIAGRDRWIGRNDKARE